MADFSQGRLRECHGSASGIRHTREADRWSCRRRENNLVVLSPTSPPHGAALSACFAKRDGAAALDRGFFHLPSGEEADPLAIGREKRIGGIFGSGEQRGLRLIEGSRGDLRLAIGALRKVRKP